MSRRNETGGWRSQTQFESRPGGSKPQKGKRPTSEWDRPRRGLLARRSETGTRRSQTRSNPVPRLISTNNEAGQPNVCFAVRPPKPPRQAAWPFVIRDIPAPKLQ